MRKRLAFLDRSLLALWLGLAIFCGLVGSSVAAGLQNTSLGCDAVDDMHLITKLAASNDIEALKATEEKLIASGKCITLKAGTEVKLITSVRAHAPGTNILYSLAKVDVASRQVYIYRQNLGP